MFENPVFRETCVVLCGFGLAACLAAQGAEKGQRKLPKPEFYAGPVSVTKVTGRIELIPGEPPRSALSVQLQNRGDKSESIGVAFRGNEAQRVQLGTKDGRQLQLTPTARHSGSGQGPQGDRVDLTPVLNGHPPGHKIAEVDLTIVLPAGVPGLIRSNMPLQRTTQNDRVAYRLLRKQVYLTELVVVYTTGPVTLQIEKSIQPTGIEPGPVEVTLRVTNLGKDASNILLEDTFDPRDFAGEGPEFKLYAGKENDRRLVWKRMIGELGAGKTIEVKFRVRAKLSVRHRSLGAAKATIERRLVGVSNKIRLRGK